MAFSAWTKISKCKSVCSRLAWGGDGGMVDPITIDPLAGTEGHHCKGAIGYHEEISEKIAEQQQGLD